MRRWFYEARCSPTRGRCGRRRVCVPKGVGLQRLTRGYVSALPENVKPASASEKTPRSDFRARREAGEFGQGHVGGDGAETRRRLEATVGAGDDPRGIADGGGGHFDAGGDHLRMLDVG